VTAKTDRLGFIALCAIALILLLFGAFSPFYLSGQMTTTPNEFGDSFGLLNALASTFGFIALIYTIHLTQQQLIRQHKEMDDSQKVQLLSARINALATLLPSLPDWTAEPVDGELNGTTPGLTKQAAAAQLEFLLDCMESKANIYLAEEVSPSLRHAVQRIERYAGDVTRDDIPATDLQRMAAVAHYWTSHASSPLKLG